TGQALVHYGIGRLHHGRYDFMAAMPHYQAALSLWPSEHDDTEFALLLLDASSAMHLSANAAAAGPLAERGLVLAERLSAPGLIARALYSSTGSGAFRQDPRPAI